MAAHLLGDVAAARLEDAAHLGRVEGFVAVNHQIEASVWKGQGVVRNAGDHADAQRLQPGAGDGHVGRVVLGGPGVRRQRRQRGQVLAAARAQVQQRLHAGQRRQYALVIVPRQRTPVPVAL